MEKVYTLSEAQEIWTKIIEKRTKELRNDLIKAKNKSIVSNNKQKLAYV